MVQSVKKCHKCSEIKSLENFYKNKARYDGIDSACIVCNKLNNKIKYKKHKSSGKYRKDYLKKAYNLSLEDYEIMLKKQKGVCAICKLPERAREGQPLAIDHCHENGFIRALLCVRCNNGLGQFKDSPHLLKLAAKYLNKFKKVSN